jgi:hypothetical protein
VRVDWLSRSRFSQWVRLRYLLRRAIIVICWLFRWTNL